MQSISRPYSMISHAQPTRLTLILSLTLSLSALIGCDDDPQPTTAGMMAGEAAGVMAGETAGMTAGTAAGMTAGEAAGMVAGTEAGEAAGMAAGTEAGEAAGMTAGTAAGEAAGMTAGESAGTMTMGGLPLDQMVSETADAMCQGLFSCCEMSDFETFFTALAFDPRYEEYVNIFPPQAELTEDNCVDTMSTLLNAAPFGAWIAQTEAGRVSYDPIAAQECLDTLRNAECGDGFLSALYDGTCLSFAAPDGGESQRKMFSRTSGVGEACAPINDGQGGVVYGSCDPSVAFCCVRRDDENCKPGFADEIGECVAVSAVGEACALFPSMQVCATGNECGEEGTCTPPPEYVPVQSGEACAEGFSLFGICENSWCDIGGSGICEPFKADGDMCIFGYECESGACNESVCGPDTYCR